MRLLTPEITALLQWFDWTHELTGTFGAVWWSMVRLPRAGAMGQQDARLMAGLEVVRNLKNRMLMSEQRKGDPDREREAFHEQVRQGDR